MVRQEPLRVSGAVLFERNLLDPALLISVPAIYVLCCTILPNGSSFATFLVTFTFLYGAFNYHLESYRSFKNVCKCVDKLESFETHVLRGFLTTHLRYLEPGYAFNNPTGSFTGAKVDGQQAPVKYDSYDYANKMIAFFWPYLSHVVHHELNNFLANSGSLAHSKTSKKRLLYAFFKQVDANILAIERCELGSNAPYIKAIHVRQEFDETAKSSLVYDLDLAYEGNMNISFICRYFCCCTSRLGLKDVFVHLSSRLIVGPIDNRAPMVEKISFSLLKLPKFGYKGIALVELAELRIAKRSINKVIKEHILFPKTQSIDLTKVAESMKQKQETHEDINQPGRIEPSDDIRILPEPISWKTRLVARMMFCACMCSNYCLRCCQHKESQEDYPGLVRRPSSRR